VTSAQSTCEKCGGTGKIRYRTPGDLEPTQFTEDTTIQNVGGWSTRACSCVRDLPAIDGEATWWELETVHHAVVPVPIFDEAVEINAEVEVPRGDDGRRYHRTAENAYYPPLITVESPARITLHSETAREIATALIAAADACDKADELAAATMPPPGPPLTGEEF
jgi:hypothetical protein